MRKRAVFGDRVERVAASSGYPSVRRRRRAGHRGRLTGRPRRGPLQEMSSAWGSR